MTSPTPATSPAPPLSRSETEGKPARTPKRGDAVTYRDIEADLHALVADVDKQGRVTLSILGRTGIWRALTGVPQDVESGPAVDESQRPNGHWRFK